MHFLLNGVNLAAVLNYAQRSIEIVQDLWLSSALFGFAVVLALLAIEL